MSHDPHAAAHGHHDSPEAIKKAVRTYIAVFIALAGLTIVTVAISRYHLPPVQAIGLALVVASIKGTLVALFFMHLIDERKAIYWTLILCAMFFACLILLPILTESETINWSGTVGRGS